MPGPITDFYEAKRALEAASVRGADQRKVMTALGYAVPEPLTEPSTTTVGKKAKPIRVFRTEGGSLIGYTAGAPYRGSRSAYEPDTPAYLAAASKADAVRRAGVPEQSRSAAARVTVEIDPSDYRYLLAASQPDHAVFVTRDNEFGEPYLVPVASPVPAGE